jgi:hypothetical protein
VNLQRDHLLICPKNNSESNLRCLLTSLKKKKGGRAGAFWGTFTKLKMQRVLVRFILTNIIIIIIIIISNHHHHVVKMT